jgi:hypothetical protein
MEKNRNKDIEDSCLTGLSASGSIKIAKELPIYSTFSAEIEGILTASMAEKVYLLNTKMGAGTVSEEDLPYTKGLRYFASGSLRFTPEKMTNGNLKPAFAPFSSIVKTGFLAGNKGSERTYFRLLYWHLNTDAFQRWFKQPSCKLGPGEKCI